LCANYIIYSDNNIDVKYVKKFLGLRAKTKSIKKKEEIDHGKHGKDETHRK